MRNIVRYVSIAASAAAIALQVSCSTETISPLLTENGELQLRPRFVRMMPNESKPLTAVAFSDGAPVFAGGLTWETLDSTVATIDSMGVLRGHTPGWARVVVRSDVGGQQDTAVVAVGMEFAVIAGNYDHACGLTTDGSAFCWGGAFSVGRNGALGTGSVPTSVSITPVAGATRYKTIAPGSTYTCALDLTGSAYCWGRPFVGGTLGTNTCAFSSSPERR